MSNQKISSLSPRKGVNGEIIPRPGEWPVDPQEDEPQPLEEKIWIDGCFDFVHHGHLGAIRQARQLGKELYVGIHTDEEILQNKGPTVMTLDERVLAVEACRWSTKAVHSAPYVTSLDWIDHYGCMYVVHGDDITSDADGADCYRYVKQAGRFKIVKRTPSISTTDLVGRMLLATTNHHVRADGFQKLIETESSGMLSLIQAYAANEDGVNLGCDVFLYKPSSDSCAPTKNAFKQIVSTKYPSKKPAPYPDQKIIYVDGGFDLFTPGHIEFLKQVVKTEVALAHTQGWNRDYSPIFVVAGIHDDDTIHKYKGLNYPIMNIYERGLCVLGCRYINAVIFCAPWTLTPEFLRTLPYGPSKAVYHGPTKAHEEGQHDPYAVTKEMGLYREIGEHKYQHIQTRTIVDRILKNREMYEARQRAKLAKAVGEEEIKAAEGGA